MATGIGLGDAGERWVLLMEALRSGSGDVACQACLGRLDEYVVAQLAGQDYVARFPEVAVHLDACPDCAGAYARIYELGLAEATNSLPQPDHLPEPDLSFLLPDIQGALSPVALRAWLTTSTLAERLRSAVRRAGNQLTLQLSADLLPLLRPAPAVSALRAPADAGRYAEMLLTLEPDDTLRPDLPLTLTAYRDARRPEVCLVEVVIEPPDRSWPELEGLTVALAVGDERREATTDAWGLAAFEGVPVAHLVDMTVEITLYEDARQGSPDPCERETGDPWRA